MLTTGCAEADHFHEECGVFGVYGHPDAAALTALGLHALQHRGQEAAGIVAYDGEQFSAHRGPGLVGDNFSSQDVRLTKTFSYRERYKLSIFAEGFNILNIANLGGYSSNLDQVTPTNQNFTFGQPTSRAGQVFGSGGPRAFQLGGRIQF